MRRYGLTLLIVVVFLLAIVPAWLGLYSGYIEFLLTVIGINIILTVSLNLINGYMGEFSVGHAAFRRVGAYTASLLTVWRFGGNSWRGARNWPARLPLARFPVALASGRGPPALGGLLVGSFHQNSTNVFMGGGFTTGGSMTYGNQNAYATIFVNTANPTAALTSAQTAKLAYGDCTTGSLMMGGMMCMTGYINPVTGLQGGTTAAPRAQPVWVCPP